MNARPRFVRARHGVPVARDGELAALPGKPDLGQHLPTALLEGVAGVLAFLYPADRS